MRVIVVPTSKYGGTAEVGRAIARTLRERGLDVDVSQPENMFDLSPYAAHIVGSGLYMGGWLDQAVDFVEEYQVALRQKPTWLFSSGPLGPDRPEIPVSPDAIERLMTSSGAKDHRLFSGRLDIDRLSRTERFITKWVGATNGDYREWDEIEAWSNFIADELIPAGERVTEGVSSDHR